MNKTTTMLSIAMLAAVMIGGSLSPAMAAEKQTFSATQTIDHIDSSTPCGNFDTQHTGIATFDLTVWDNNSSLLKYSEHSDFHDLSGNLVGQINLVEVIRESTGGLPYVETIQGTLTCVGTGLVDEVHIGITVDENGNFHIHHDY